MPTATPAPTLSLAREQFAKVAPASYLAAHLPRARPSGRTADEFRTPSCTTSSLAHTAGSAVVRVGRTSVVCGVTAETLLARDAAGDTLAALGLLVPNVELSTGCDAAHAPQGGGPPSAEAQVLGVRVLRLLLGSGLVRAADLAVRRGGEGADADDVVAYWTLYVNVLVLSLDGAAGALDACWAAVYAALRDVRLPRAWWDEDRGVVVCSDRVDEARPLALQGRPVACTWGVFVVPPGTVRAVMQGQEVADEAENRAGETFTLADPDEVETGICEETVTVVLDCSNAPAKILSVMKGGGGAVGLDEMSTLFAEAEKRWAEWDASLP